MTKESQRREAELILRSAEMALKQYADLVDAESGTPLTNQSKWEVIACNADAWITRVRSADLTSYVDTESSEIADRLRAKDPFIYK